MQMISLNKIETTNNYTKKLLIKTTYQDFMVIFSFHA